MASKPKKSSDPPVPTLGELLSGLEKDIAGIALDPAGPLTEFHDKIRAEIHELRTRSTESGPAGSSPAARAESEACEERIRGLEDQHRRLDGLQEGFRERHRGLASELRDLRERVRPEPETQEARWLASMEGRLRAMEPAAAAAVETVPLPTPARRSGTRTWIAVAAAGTLGAGALAGAWWWSGRSLRHPIPFSHPTGLVFSGSELWATDWVERAVYRLRLQDGKLTVVGRHVLAGSHPTALAIAGGSIYIADSWKREIVRFRMGAALPRERSWPSPGTNPSALHFDGRYLWSADAASKRIYQHALDEELTLLASHPLSYAPSAILSAEGRLWIGDPEGRRLAIHLRDPGLSAVGGRPLPALQGTPRPLSAAARLGGKVWLGLDGSAELLEIPARLLKRR